MTTTTIRTLASGTMVEVDARGRMVSFVGCTWMVLRAPKWDAELYATLSEEEADNYAECYSEVCAEGARPEECGARVKETHGGNGWACADGHSHVAAEVRQAEGWDYAEDADEAKALATALVTPMAMDGSGPWVL